MTNDLSYRDVVWGAAILAPTFFSVSLEWNPIWVSPALWAVSFAPIPEPHKKTVHYSNLTLLAFNLARLALGTRFTIFGGRFDALLLSTFAGLAIWTNWKATTDIASTSHKPHSKVDI